MRKPTPADGLQRLLSRRPLWHRPARPVFGCTHEPAVRQSWERVAASRLGLARRGMDAGAKRLAVRVQLWGRGERMDRHAEHSEPRAPAPLVPPPCARALDGCEHGGTAERRGHWEDACTGAARAHRVRRPWVPRLHHDRSAARARPTSTRHGPAAGPGPTNSECGARCRAGRVERCVELQPLPRASHAASGRRAGRAAPVARLTLVA